MMQEGPLIHSQILINHRGADDELCMFGGVPLHTGVFQWHWPNNRNWDYHNNNNHNIGAIWCKKADTITSEGDGKDDASAWTRRGFLPQAARFYTKIIGLSDKLCAILTRISLPSLNHRNQNRTQFDT